MKLVFIAHQVSVGHMGTQSDIEVNLRKAARWVRWAGLCHPVIPIAPYIEYCAAFDELNPVERRHGMNLCRQVLERCDELWLCGARISDGMSEEQAIAEQAGITVVDHTGPDDPFPFQEAEDHRGHQMDSLGEGLAAEASG